LISTASAANDPSAAAIATTGLAKDAIEAIILPDAEIAENGPSELSRLLSESTPPAIEANTFTVVR